MIFFFLLILTLPLTTHPLWSSFVGDLTIVKYVGGICFLYAVFHLLFESRALPSWFGSWPARWFMMFYLIAALSFLTHGADIPWQVSPLFTYTSLALLFFITLAIVDSPKRLHQTLLVAIGSVAFASLYVIREWQKFHAVVPNFRPGYVTGDANYFAISCVLCIPLAFYLMIGRQPLWHRALCFGCMIVTLIGVTLAASRGGFLGLVIAFLYLVARSKHRLTNFVLVCAVMIPLSVLSPSSPLQRLLHPNRGDKESVEDHQIAWRAGLGMIKSHPFFGVGLGNFKPEMKRYTPEGVNVDTIAHNTYVELAAELGIPGLLLYLTMIFSSLRTLENVHRRAIRSDQPTLGRAAAGIQAGLVGFAVSSFFLSAEYQRLLWLMIFLSATLPSILRSAAKDRTKRIEVSAKDSRAEQSEAVSSLVG
jgi:probable O-glycosylation ligase (exosortase A-associated)